MQYKLHYEPMYNNECRAILIHVLNNTSIRKEMENVIRDRGESTRSLIEPLFEKSIELEEHVKKHLCLALPGYEDKGEELAEFLLTKWEKAEEAPLDAICYYELLLKAGVENKAVLIMYIIGLGFMEQVYSAKDIEMGVIPPTLSDGEFFSYINQSPLNQEDRLKAMDFYYNFSMYREYSHLLLKHTEELLKDKIKSYANKIRNHMNSIEQHILTKNGVLVDNPKVSISEQDELTYQIYPSIYQPNSLIMSGSSLFSPYVIIGISFYLLDELRDRAKLDEEKAIQFLKSLSDNTKQTILRLLKEESLYGSQLAEKLDCTGANVSQHMNNLLKLDVVSVRKENNRIYYCLNKEAIHKHLDVVREMFG